MKIWNNAALEDIKTQKNKGEIIEMKSPEEENVEYNEDIQIIKTNTLQTK